MTILSPSLLASDFSKLGTEAAAVDLRESPYLHLDIMDGVFVPNLTFGPDVVRSLRPYTKAVFDTHLMVLHPQTLIDAFVRAGSDIITIHAEADCDVHRVLSHIHASSCRAGLALKPSTDPDVLLPYLSLLDHVLVMTVEPGFGGQALIPQTLDKIRAVSSLLKKAGSKATVGADGGINLSNISLVRSAGASVLVAGSAIFGSEDRADAVRALLHAADKNGL